MTTAITPIHLNIGEEAFDEHYPLVPNHLDPHAGWVWAAEYGCLFGLSDEELSFVFAQPPAHVWTLVDGDEHQHLLSGVHFVNRVGYLVSRVPVPAVVTISVEIRDPDASE